MMRPANGVSLSLLREHGRLGAPLTVLLRMRGVTQDEIARQSGVTRKRVGQVLNRYVMANAGAVSPAYNETVLRATAEALGVSFRELRAWWDELPERVVGAPD